MIQFDYELHSYFGNHLKVVIEDGILRYRYYMVDFPGRNNWITPEIPEIMIQRFLSSLEALEGCIEDYRNDSVLDGVEYTIICQTEDIRKTIHGYHDYQSTVRTILQQLKAMDPGLSQSLEEASKK